MSIRKIGNSWFADFYKHGIRVRRKLSANKAAAQKIYDAIIKNRDLSLFGINDNEYDIKQIRENADLKITCDDGYQKIA